MKRDMNLIRELLLMLGAAATDRGFSFEEEEAETLKCTLDQIRYNLRQAEEMGLIEALSKPLNGECKYRLTSKGHDFLERGQNTEDRVASPSQATASPTAVFIVHGHDEGLRESVARFIEKLGFEAIILHARPNKGRTIITKFREEAAGVGFAVVLMTPDDVGKAKEGTDLKPRARQNVIFELGFFIGALRPEHVAALVKGEIELPSDYDGVVYISMDKEDWRTKLAKEMEAAHYDLDWNKVMRS